MGSAAARHPEWGIRKEEDDEEEVEEETGARGRMHCW